MAKKEIKPVMKSSANKNGKMHGNIMVRQQKMAAVKNEANAIAAKKGAGLGGLKGL